jgi:hypothetical protein
VKIELNNGQSTLFFVIETASILYLIPSSSPRSNSENLPAEVKLTRDRQISVLRPSLFFQSPPRIEGTFCVFVGFNLTLTASDLDQKKCQIEFVNYWFHSTYRREGRTIPSKILTAKALQRKS